MAASKRILVLLNYYLPYLSGLTEYARRLAEALSQNGYAVTVLAARHESELPEEEEIKGVHVIRTPVLTRIGKGVISPTFVTKAVTLAKAHDVVHMHLPMAESGLIAPFLDRRKLLITYHCDVNLGDGLLNRTIEWLSYRLMGIAMGRAKVIVGNSRNYFDASHFARFRDRFTQIYPPIDTREYQRTTDPDFLTSFGVRQDAYKIGFVGRIVYEKGINYLFEAIPFLKERIGDFQIIIAGDSNVAGGGIMDELRPYIERYREDIVFTGRLSHQDLVRFYSNIDVLVLPSIDPLESFGMVQVEAMSCGTPVVASDMPGVNEVLLKTNYGRLAQPKDPEDLAASVFRVYREQTIPGNFLRADWDIDSTLTKYLHVLDAKFNR